jgi:IMP dehydrogenase/GMP reductase
MSNDDLFDRFEALTFDDVVIVPDFSPVSLPPIRRC